MDYQSHLNMALLALKALFIDAGIPKEQAAAYAQKFVDNALTTDLICHLTDSALKDLGVDVLGYRLRIMAIGKPSCSRSSKSLSDVKILSPLLLARTVSQFETFLGEWKMHKQLKKVSSEDSSIVIYSFCDIAVKEELKLTHSYDDLIAMSEKELLDLLKVTVIKGVNNGVRRSRFYKMMQQPEESVMDFMKRLQTAERWTVSLHAIIVMEIFKNSIFLINSVMAYLTLTCNSSYLLIKT